MIENLRKHRADGRVVPHEISVEDYLRLGWPPSAITKLEWTVGPETFACERYERICYALSASGSYLALLVDPNAANEAQFIDILDQFGSKIGQVSTPSAFSGQPLEGHYIGLADSIYEPGDVFVARFQATNREIFNVYIEPEPASICQVTEGR